MQVFQSWLSLHEILTILRCLEITLTTFNFWCSLPFIEIQWSGSIRRYKRVQILKSWRIFYQNLQLKRFFCLISKSFLRVHSWRQNFEKSYVKWPKRDTIFSFWNEHLIALLQFLLKLQIITQKLQAERTSSNTMNSNSKHCKSIKPATSELIDLSWKPHSDIHHP